MSDVTLSEDEHGGQDYEYVPRGPCIDDGSEANARDAGPVTSKFRQIRVSDYEVPHLAGSDAMRAIVEEIAWMLLPHAGPPVHGGIKALIPIIEYSLTKKAIRHEGTAFVNRVLSFYQDSFRLGAVFIYTTRIPGSVSNIHFGNIYSSIVALKKTVEEHRKGSISYRSSDPQRLRKVFRDAVWHLKIAIGDARVSFGLISKSRRIILDAQHSDAERPPLFDEGLLSMFEVQMWSVADERTYTHGVGAGNTRGSYMRFYFDLYAQLRQVDFTTPTASDLPVPTNDDDGDADAAWDVATIDRLARSLQNELQLGRLSSLGQDTFRTWQHSAARQIREAIQLYETGEGFLCPPHLGLHIQLGSYLINLSVIECFRQATVVGGMLVMYYRDAFTRSPSLEARLELCHALGAFTLVLIQAGREQEALRAMEDVLELVWPLHDGTDAHQDFLGRVVSTYVQASSAYDHRIRRDDLPLSHTP
ncbi:unnamed protein product [Tilletia controversa]|nr:unnamed protein product [Tilletia controversa]